MDGAVVFYKAFSVRHWVQSLTKRKGKKYDEKVCMSINYTKKREGLIS